MTIRESKNKFSEPSLYSSLKVGLLAVFAGAVLLLIFFIPISFRMRFLIFGLFLLFLIVFVWHYYSKLWELYARRRAIVTLQTLGSFLILKAVSDPILHILNAELIFSEENSPFSGKLFIALTSTPWQLDLTLGILGFLMIIGVLLATSNSLKLSDLKRVFGKSEKSVVVNLNVGNSTNKEIKVRIPDYRALKTYDSDLPPLIDIWVGRASELTLFEEIENVVAVITGIGGQGKSALAAKVLECFRNDNSSSFWDWRDCKEQIDRFRTHLISIIERLSEGRITADMLNDADVSWLSKFFFSTFGSQKGFMVFDNVDHYVDIGSNRFISDVSTFVQEALRVKHNFLIIFTCRPRISYPSVRFREVYLRGFELEETVDLFQKKKLQGSLISADKNIVFKLHELTSGHPLWLNIIASQISRNPNSGIAILKQLEAGKIDDRTNSMLRSVWSGLNENQKTVLQYMAELPRSMELELIAKYIGDKLTYNRFNRAFKTLRAISLLTEKTAGDSNPSRFELHPLVRGFVRQEFRTRADRDSVLDVLLSNCDLIVLKLSESQSKIITIELLEQLTAKTEMMIARGRIVDAIDTLLSFSQEIFSRGIVEEFVRLGNEIIEQTNFDSSPWANSEKFDQLIIEMSQIMAEIGHSQKMNSFLQRYAKTIPQKTARYISLCDTLAYFEWFNGNYKEAILWGQKGVELKKTSGIDTNYDSSHNLALAKRDFGEIDEALEYFCYGEPLKEILNHDYLKSGRAASFYGNIGRCLSLLDRNKEALCLYCKSFDLLEIEKEKWSMLNKGYAAFWIGETLEKLGNISEAYRFYRKSRLIWRQRSPKRAELPCVKIKKIDQIISDEIKSSSDEEIQKYCAHWVANYQSKLLEIN